MKEDPFVVWGDGRQSRAFQYITDLTEAFLLAANVVTDATSVNLGTSDDVTIQDLAEMILNLTGYSTKIVFDKSAPQGVKVRRADPRRANELLGWRPKITLEEGLKKTISWFVESSVAG
jgi:nucleoside-diphosphate-sugar epimerase